MPTPIILTKDSDSIKYLSKKDKRLAKVISIIGDISYIPHENDPYSFLIHEIIEQMLSIKAGAKIYERLNQLCNDNITPQTINALSDEQIKSIGTAGNKVKYIRCVTNAVLKNELDFNQLQTLTDQEVLKKLTSIKGVGTWTAKMYLIFVLNRQDILPYEDVAFIQAYSWLYKTSDCTRTSIEKKCKKWKPYSSIAARYLYKALDTGLTKTEFHLYK